jgi:hypothetical protein
MYKKTNFALSDGLRVKTDVLPVGEGFFVMKVESKKIIGYENYSIDTNGRVFSRNIDKEKASRKDKHGYEIVNLCLHSKNKTFRVHRLVAKHFLDDYSEELVVDHINGAKTDNRLENLRMCSMDQNKRGYRRQQGVSKWRGVSKYRDTWRACICIDGKCLWKYGKDEKLLAIWWNEKAKEAGYFPEALNKF